MSSLFGPSLGFGGYRVVESVHALEPVNATIWDEPKFSRHRSRRLWKKLRKKTARSHPGNPCIYQANGMLIVHPALMPELRRLAP